jgi:hypothetical protein
VLHDTFDTLTVVSVLDVVLIFKIKIRKRLQIKQNTIYQTQLIECMWNTAHDCDFDNFILIVFMGNNRVKILIKDKFGK